MLYCALLYCIIIHYIILLSIILNYIIFYPVIFHSCLFLLGDVQTFNITVSVVKNSLHCRPNELKCVVVTWYHDLGTMDRRGAFFIVNYRMM